MTRCDRSLQTLLAVLGSFAAFSLMSVAIGTDYWLYSRAHVCNATNVSADETQTRRVKGDLTHSGLWRICCLEGVNKGDCFRINHFPDDDDYDADSSEYILRVVRASSLFPILSTVLLMTGGLCAGVGRVYGRKNHVLLGAGILFVAAGLSNIIGIIVFISSNTGDPGDKKGEDKKNQYNYGWSFYFGALSFIVAESVGVLAVNIYIENNKEMHVRARRVFIKPSTSPYSRIPSHRHGRRRRSRSSSRSSGPSRDASPGGGLSLYALSRDPRKVGNVGPYGPERDFLQVHDCFQKEVQDGVDRRSTPV